MNKVASTAAIILAAGKGTRIGPHLPKVLYSLAGKPMISYILNTLSDIGLKDIYVVTGYRSEDVQASINRRASFVYQANPLGTGHAVDCALKEIPPDTDTVIVVNGDDSSFYSKKTIEGIISSHHDSNSVITIASIETENPTGLGRIIRDEKGNVAAIREEAAATDSEKQIKEINIGFYVFNVDWIRKTISNIKLSKSGEIYLVDVVELACAENKIVNSYSLTNSKEWHGINTQEQLELANQYMLTIEHDKVKNTKNILMDLDDTLLSTVKLKEKIEEKIVYTVKNVFSSTLTDSEIKSRFWKVYAEHKSQNGWVSTPELGQLLANSFDLENGAETFKRLLYTLPFRDYIKDGVPELLKNIKGKFNRVILAYGDLVYQPLKLSVFNGLIDNYHVYEQLDNKSLKEISKVYANSETIVLDDKLENLEKFSKSMPNIKTIWIKGGPDQSEIKYSPTFTVSSIDELSKVLESI